jgi:hypothetical protein
VKTFLKVLEYAKLDPAISHSQGRNSNIKQSRNRAPMKYESVPEEYKKIIEWETALYKVG